MYVVDAGVPSHGYHSGGESLLADQNGNLGQVDKQWGAYSCPSIEKDSFRGTLVTKANQIVNRAQGLVDDECYQGLPISQRADDEAFLRVGHGDGGIPKILLGLAACHPLPF